jgi:thioredoxin-related protein
MSEVKGKDGKAIQVGDAVSGKARGGKHAGEVEQVITTKEEADKHGVKNPPKVLFTDQHGKFELPGLGLMTRPSC